MSEKLVNRILLVNDDGIDAQGIKLLKSVAENLANEVWVVAPVIDQSGVSCSVSLKSPFRVDKRSEREYAVYGTPADCSLFAIKYLMKNCLPDLVLSGINNGSNVGFETILSGTVGGAIMAMTLGVPAMALSQLSFEDNIPTNWDTSIHHAESTIRKLLSISTPNNIIYNINLPACGAKQVKGTKITKQGEANVNDFVIVPTKDPDGFDYYWFRAKGYQQIFDEEKELDASYNGYITVTPISYERTYYPFYEKLKHEFDCI